MIWRNGDNGKKSRLKNVLIGVEVQTNCIDDENEDHING